MTQNVPAPSRLVIASRESRLALWQAEHVRDRLRALHPSAAVEILGMTTRGDQILDRPLAAIGGKGLFIKELEVAMAEGRADLAVHSLKDVPMEMPEGFVLAAIPVRETPFDAFVSSRYADLEALPPGAVVGTSSLRRAALLRARFPQLRIESLRGNLDTRLRKLDAGDYDAIILACAGLERLELGGRIRDRLRAPHWLPAPAQAAVAVECRADATDVIALLAGLDDAGTRACVEAERAMNRALGGSCHVPVAGLAQWRGDDLWLQGLVGGVVDGRRICAEAQGPANDPEALGRNVARQLLGAGAGELLR